MKLSFSTLGCPELTWNEIVSAARDLGYDGIEVRGVERDVHVPSIPQFKPDQAQKTREQLEKLRLEIPCLTSDCVLHLKAYQHRTLDEGAAYIETARLIGAPYIRVLADDPNPWPGAPVDEGLVVETARELEKAARAAGVTLLIETNGYFSNTAHLARVLKKIDSPHVAALLDAHHPHRYARETPETSVKNLMGFIKHVHLKDSVLADRVRYTMMGYGDVPVLDYVNLLRDGGYEGYFSLEWVRRWDLTLEEPGIAFAQYVSFMRSL